MQQTLKRSAAVADELLMGSVLTIAALVVVLGFAFGGWAVFTVGSATDDALERDERDISRGRHSDNDDN